MQVIQEFNRKKIQLHICYFFAGLLFFLPPAPCKANSLPGSVAASSLQKLSGIDRHYNLSFLWFERLAVGQLTFSRDPLLPTRYRALLEAKTLGVASWLTGERSQHYETLMEMTGQGRLQPLEYRSIIRRKKGSRIVEQTKLYTFDAAKRTLMVTRGKDGKLGPNEPFKIAGNEFPVDFLTAGFNFISGADGPVRPGDRKEIVTFTSDGERKIIIEVLRDDQWPKTAFFTKGSGTLIKVILPTEILDTSGGAVYALLDEKLLPQRVIVENVLGMGEVKGIRKLP